MLTKALKFGLLMMVLSVSVWAKEYKIAALYWSMNIPGQVAMRRGLEAEVKKINAEAKKSNAPQITLIEYVAGDGAQGMEKQIGQFKDALSKKVDGIVVQPTDNAALSGALIEANAANIPVVAYDQYIDGGKLESFVTSDNYQAGFLDGEYASHLFKAKKELNIAIVEYPHVSSTVSRVDGFIDALEKYKVKYKILKRYEAVEPVAGRRVGKQILKDFPTKGSLDLVFTVNDGGGLSVAQEIVSAKRDDIALATVDGDPESTKIIKNRGIIKIDSAQFCGPMGGVALRSLYDVLGGKKVGKQILIPVFPITAETISRYPGWLGPIPAKFKKPWESISPYWLNELKSK